MKRAAGAWRSIEGNDLAKAFLKGYKSGIETAGQKNRGEEEKKEAG